jgi:hypothetical protein
MTSGLFPGKTAYGRLQGATGAQWLQGVALEQEDDKMIFAVLKSALTNIEDTAATATVRDIVLVLVTGGVNHKMLLKWYCSDTLACHDRSYFEEAESCDSRS